MPVPGSNDLVDVTRIYYEPAAAELPRGRQVLGRWPDATRVPVESHWRIPELHGDEANVDRWVRIKREALVLEIEKSLQAKPNGRSADFIASSQGCAMACHRYVRAARGTATRSRSSRTSSRSPATSPVTSPGRA